MGRKRSPRITHPIALANAHGKCQKRVTPGGKLCGSTAGAQAVRVDPDMPDYVSNLVVRCPKHRTVKID